MHTHISLHELERVFTLEATRLRRLQRLWLDIYEYYAQPISDNQLLWYSRDMGSYPLERVAAAMLAWRKGPCQPGHKPRAPVPQELMALLGTQETLEGTAIKLATRMWNATSTYGRLGGERACAALGEDAVAAIKEMGGWGKVVQSANNKKEENFIAQTRELIKATMVSRGQSPQQRLLAACEEEVAEMIGEAPKPQQLAERGQGQLTGVGATVAKLVPHG